MALIDPKIVWGGLALIAVGAWYSLSPAEDSKSTITPVKHRPLVASVGLSDFELADYSAHFNKPKAKAKNLFMPVYHTAPVTPIVSGAAITSVDRIPAGYAGGDPNWVFTGFAIVDGVKMALLENTAKHQGTCVKQGEVWNGSTIRQISSASVVLVDADGIEQVVMRFNPNAAAKPGAAVETPPPTNNPAPAAGPAGGPMRGRIGPAPVTQIVGPNGTIQFVAGPG